MRKENKRNGTAAYRAVRTGSTSRAAPVERHVPSAQAWHLSKALHPQHVERHVPSAQAWHLSKALHPQADETCRSTTSSQASTPQAGEAPTNSPPHEQSI